MNKDTIVGKWKQLSGRSKHVLGRLIHNDVLKYEGNSEWLAGAAQQDYGLIRDEARRQIKQLINMNMPSNTSCDAAIKR